MTILLIFKLIPKSEVLASPTVFKVKTGDFISDLKWSYHISHLHLSQVLSLELTKFYILFLEIFGIMFALLLLMLDQC